MCEKGQRMTDASVECDVWQGFVSKLCERAVMLPLAQHTWSKL